MLRTVLAYIRAQWMGALALFLVIAGGTAYAANTVGSSDIIDGEVKTADIGNNQVYSADVRNDTQPNGGLTDADLAAESVASSELKDGSIKDVDLDASAQGARAFGLVLGANVCPVGGFCQVLRDKGVAYVAHVGQGKYCIGLNGINATDPTALALVNPAFSTGVSWAYWRAAIAPNSACVDREFEIYTGKPGTGFADDAFTILVP
jgi:hypothetical protein